MNIKKTILIPLFILLFTGCIKEDRTDCITDNNAELRFEYSVMETEFLNYIHTVDVILFDETGHYLLHRRADEQALKLHQGMKFTIDPGKYYVVAWANISSNSKFCDFIPGVTHFDDCVLEISPDANESGDPVYYAPNKAKPGTKSVTPLTRTTAKLSSLEIEIPFGQKVEKVLDFTRAHRTINVWINKHIDPSGDPNELPTVDATQLWSRYDFTFTPQSLRRDYSQLSKPYTISGSTYSLASFHSAYGEITGDTDIIVRRTSDGTARHMVNLKQFITANSITDTDQVDIMVTFLEDMGVTVTVPTWTGKPVEPGID